MATASKPALGNASRVADAKGKAKKDRLAKALRENLLRRKAAGK